MCVEQMKKKNKVRGQSTNTHRYSHTHTHAHTILGQTKCVGAMTFFKFRVFTSKGLQAQMATG